MMELEPMELTSGTLTIVLTVRGHSVQIKTHSDMETMDAVQAGFLMGQVTAYAAACMKQMAEASKRRDPSGGDEAGLRAGFKMGMSTAEHFTFPEQG